MFQDVSLKSVLMYGPHLTNNVVEILMRFCENAIAICSGIQQMFNAFHVHKEHQNVLVLGK